jgi:hypothetical protein
LLKTNPFNLLAQAGHVDAFAETMDLPNWIKKFGALGEWATILTKDGGIEIAAPRIPSKDTTGLHTAALRLMNDVARNTL